MQRYLIRKADGDDIPIIRLLFNNISFAALCTTHKSLSVQYLPEADLSANSPKNLSQDGFHPSALGGV